MLKKIREVLDDIKYGEDITFKDFLKKLELTEQSFYPSYETNIKA